MHNLAPDYLAEISRQIGFISAFLGGVAATLMGTLLHASDDRRATSLATASAAASAVLLIVAVVATTLVIIVTHPHAPAEAAKADLAFARISTFLAFIFGIYLLLASIAACGWMRSRKMGIFTTSISIVAALSVTSIIVN